MYGRSDDTGLGIAPVVVAVVPLATKLIGSIIGLFKKKPKQPSAADLERVRNYFDFRVKYWADAYEKGNADAAAMNLDIIKRAGAVPGSTPSQLYRDYADAALAVINQYVAENPPRTVTTTDGKQAQIDANADQTKLVKKADGSGYDRIDVATGQNLGPVTSSSGGSIIKAGTLGGMPALVIFGGLASLLLFAASTDKRR